MALDNFAILAQNITVGIGSSLTITSQDGTNTADAGEIGTLSNGGVMTVTGRTRFMSTPNIAGVPPVSIGVTGPDPLVGVIESISGLIQSYLFLANYPDVILQNTYVGGTVQLFPGVSFCDSSFTSVGTTFNLNGGAEDTYIIIIEGDATIVGTTFTGELSPNLIAIVTGGLFFGSPGNNTVCGTWYAGGNSVFPQIAIQGGTFTLNPGRLIGTPNVTFTLDAGLIATITMPGIITTSTVLAPGFGVALPDSAVVCHPSVGAKAPVMRLHGRAWKRV